MIGLEDRRDTARKILKAHSNGARLHLACGIAGIDVRTLQRWKGGHGLTAGDGRPAAVRAPPAHALSTHEREELLRVANAPRFADVPPARIVPMLADEGVYLASESSFARVLRAHGQSPIEVEPRHPAPRSHRPRTSQPVRVRSGAGT
jgi:putative transposase